ncbi:MAG: Mpo1-like protein [Leptonema sp. (in: bacteria)]
MKTIPKNSIQNYEDFWYFYLQEHSHPINRVMHYVGTTGVILIFLYSIYSMNFWYFFALPICGYGFAWFGHFFIEKNRPATFTYPFWSLISDFRMYFYFLFGRLSKHLQKKEEYRFI